MTTHVLWGNRAGELREDTGQSRGLKGESGGRGPELATRISFPIPSSSSLVHVVETHLIKHRSSVVYISTHLESKQM